MVNKMVQSIIVASLFLIILSSAAFAGIFAYPGDIAGNIQKSFQTSDEVFVYVESSSEVENVFAVGLITGSSWLQFIGNREKEQIAENLWRWQVNNALPGNAEVSILVLSNGIFPIHFSFTVIDEMANLLSLHDPDSSDYDSDCIKCHGDKLNERTLNRKIPPFHAAMVPEIPGYKGGTAEDCIFCHKSVDLLQESAGNLRRNINVDSCVTCHGPGGPGKQFYQ